MKKRKSLRKYTGYIGLMIIVLLLQPCICNAATDNYKIKMDGALWSNGKIYVVVIVIFTIFLGIILTLLYIERQIKKLEKKTN